MLFNICLIFVARYFKKGIKTLLWYIFHTKCPIFSSRHCIILFTKFTRPTRNLLDLLEINSLIDFWLDLVDKLGIRGFCVKYAFDVKWLPLTRSLYRLSHSTNATSLDLFPWVALVVVGPCRKFPNTLLNWDIIFD